MTIDKILPETPLEDGDKVQKTLEAFGWKFLTNDSLKWTQSTIRGKDGKLYEYFRYRQNIISEYQLGMKFAKNLPNKDILITDAYMRSGELIPREQEMRAVYVKD